MLKLLLDEHISPAVAAGMRRRDRKLVVFAMVELEAGRLLGREDSECLRQAGAQRLTLVTYDQRTIASLLKDWAEERQSHAGVIFIDDKTIPQRDIGALVRSLCELAKETRDLDWTDRVQFLERWYPATLR